MSLKIAEFRPTDIDRQVLIGSRGAGEEAAYAFPIVSANCKVLPAGATKTGKIDYLEIDKKADGSVAWEFFTADDVAASTQAAAADRPLVRGRCHGKWRSDDRRA